MREIKFRAWDKEVKRITYDIYFYEFTDINDQFEDEDELVFLQYTGLKDKNGKEIYEGDIVKVLGLDENNNQIFRTCEVVFNKGSFVFKFEDGFYFYHNSIFEVIGNKFENPELLREE